MSSFYSATLFPTSSSLQSYNGVLGHNIRAVKGSHRETSLYHFLGTVLFTWMHKAGVVSFHILRDIFQECLNF